MTTRKMQEPGVDDDRLSAAAVVARLKEAFGIETDAALAEALRTSKQNISKWKSRNAVPYAEAVLVSFRRNVSLDYLLTGDAEDTPKLKRPSKLDEEILRAILLNVHGFGLIDLPGNRDARQALTDTAKAIAFQYARAEDVIRELVSNKGLDPDAARSAAIVATEMLGSDGTVFGSRRPVSKRKF